MEQLVHQFILPPLWALFYLGLFVLPVVAIGVVLQRRKRQYSEEAVEPFTELPLRPPGESLRLKIDQLAEKYDESLTTAGIAAVGGGVLVFAAPTDQKLLYGLGAALVCIPTYWKSGRVMLRTQRDLWRYRLGFTGERVVGEELNQLLARGYRVFHDLPFDGFNIDHVIVGRTGVFAVETKTRRKRAGIKGTAKATLHYDGQRLIFPQHQGESWLKQAKRNAETLSEWLSSATGERVHARAILTIPGWWIERTGEGSVAVEVLNPKMIGSYLSDQPLHLTGDAMQRITHQLTEKCRLANEPKPAD
jgi:hypothetical protein